MSEPMLREGLVLGMPEDEYHGGGALELSSTSAKLLLEAPARFEHVVLKQKREEKPEWDLGSAVHTKVLGVGSPAIAYPEKVLSASGAASTNAAKDWAAEQRAGGLIPVKRELMQQINEMSNALLMDVDARALLELEGDPEVSVFASCPDTGVRLRARIDWMPREYQVACDVKTVGRSGGAKETEFTKQIFNFGYDVQGGQYTDTIRYATGRDMDFAFLVVESVAPYLTNVIVITNDYMEMGRAKSMKARRRYKHGMETGEWPGYKTGIKRVAPPMMAVYDYQDNYEGGLL